MSGYVDFIKKHKTPHMESWKDDMRARKDPSFFWPNGTQVYVGRQGSGKTISAIFHLMKLKERYPESIVVSNINLNFLKPKDFHDKTSLIRLVDTLDKKSEYVRFQSMEGLSLSLVNVNNGFKGVIYIVDEIHTYFNALESKNIPMYVFTEISQQRKQRKLIIGTSQLFLRMAKPFREQCDSLIVCSTRFGVLTKQIAYDGATIEQDYDGSLTGEVKKKGFFFHNRKIRNGFDTYQKVVSGQEQYESVQKPIYLDSKKKIRVS